MTRSLAIVALFVAACSPAKERASDTLAAVDTLKPATVTDTLAAGTDTLATKAAPPATKTQAAPPRTKTSKLGRDSAFPPPKLPQLDTVKKKPPTR